MKQFFNNNQRTVAEVEIRFGVKVYKFEAKSNLKWVVVVAFVLAKLILEKASG